MYYDIKLKFMKTIFNDTSQLTRISRFVLAPVLISMFFIASCAKEKNFSSDNRILNNTAPKVDVGKNIFLTLPENSCRLFGYATDNENNIDKYFWKKISGPQAFSILYADSAVATLYNLEKGIYEFEFTAIDSKGLQAKDTIVVYVNEQGTNEVFFPDRTWTCPFGCFISIENFDKFIPANTAFEVYHNKNSAAWIKIPPSGTNDFSYMLDNNRLIIYGDPGKQHIDIRVTF